MEIDFSKKRRAVIKVGTHSLTHHDTGFLDYIKIERLVMEICNLKNKGLDVVLVSSGAIATGRQTLDIKKENESMAKKQALASIGQARLMALYEKFFAEFNQIAGQVLLTRHNLVDEPSKSNALNTFEELFKMDVVPVVNANDTTSTFEISFGDNDTLGALVANLIGADILVLLTDIEGLYTGDPSKDKNAKLISLVESISDEHFAIASSDSGSNMGTGGMKTKLRAGVITTKSGIDMVIASGMDMSIISNIFKGDFVGTEFLSNYDPSFDLIDFIREE